MVSIQEKAMESAMPSAQDIFDNFNKLQKRIQHKSPNSPAAENPQIIDLKSLIAARRIWQSLRNPHTTSNDPDHPNNWTQRNLLSIAGIIQSSLDIPSQLYSKELF